MGASGQSGLFGPGGGFVIDDPMLIVAPIRMIMDEFDDGRFGNCQVSVAFPQVGVNVAPSLNPTKSERLLLGIVKSYKCKEDGASANGSVILM